MQPQHHRTLVIAAETVGPDVKTKAVLAHAGCRNGGANFGNFGMWAYLRSLRAPLDRVFDAAPGFGLNRWQEPAGSGGRSTVGDALEGVDLVDYQPANFTVGCFDGCARLRLCAERASQGGGE